MILDQMKAYFLVTHLKKKGMVTSWGIFYFLESENVKVDDLNTKGIKSQDNPQFDERIRDDDDEEIKEIQEDESQSEYEKEEEESPRQDTKAPSRRIQINHPESQIPGKKGVGVETRRKLTYE